jgi:uncharacterized membrane protein
MLVGWAVAVIAIRPRLKPELRERMARWRAFRRFLKRFSSLPDAPALALIIWERYLVYATALGVAKRVEKQVKALVPLEELPAPFPGAPPGMAATSGTPSSSARSTRTNRRDGGFGGGFSGGGGGGGGGTGGGAW